jgi:predicted O-methyltransferase YrrM
MEQDRETPKDVAALTALLELGNRLGFIYGSEDVSILLYSLIRREMPRNIVELGTGLGVSTFWMAQALKENGQGQLHTFDDASHWQDSSEVNRAIEPLREIDPLSSLPKSGLDYEGYIRTVTRLLGQSDIVTFLKEKIDLTDETAFLARGYPFLREPVDFVFADIQRGPDDILDVFSVFLPLAAESSSIFIDSASTSLTGYLFLEKLVDQLNSGKVPRHFMMKKTPQQCRQMVDLIQLRRFTLVHLVERKRRNQNSTAWIKIEPVDYVPHPMTLMKM